ncbi:MAG: serine hydrolase domain-containing protein, partial [Planctomycetota bacterium]
MFYAHDRSKQQPVSAVTITLTRLTLFACCVTILIANVGSAQSLAPEEVATLDEMVDAVVEGVSPGVAIGIVRDGEVVYERYAGYAELDHEVPIDPKTRFNIASNAKQFTALCVLRLVDEGKLSLDDDIRKYFPELYPDYPMPITIGNLITHTSGIRDVYDLYGLTGNVWWKQFIGNREALDLLQRQTELNFEPGSDYLYSNSNYLLLTEVIAQVTGEAFGTYTTEMFQALGMPDTEFLTNAMTVMPHRARPYGDWGGWKQYASIASVHGDGNLFTTLRDQLTWEQTVQRGHCDLFDAELMAAGQGPLPGQDIETYGFGIELGSYHGFQDRSHAGSTGAYNAYFIRLPSEQLAVVVMSNSTRVASHRLALKTVDLLLELEDPTASF